jgi:hypothetical protein
MLLICIIFVTGLCMNIASANIQICQAVRDLVYSTSTKRQQDRMSLCVESVTRSSSQLRDLLLSHEFLQKSSTDNEGTDLDSNLQTQDSRLLGFFDVSEDNSHLSISKSLQEDRKDGSLSPHTPRSSVEKDTNINEIDSSFIKADSHVENIVNFNGQNQQGSSLFTDSPCLSSSTISSQALSLPSEAFMASLASGDSPDGDLSQLSPQHSSTLLSISSSLHSTSLSSNVGQVHVEGNALVAAESKDHPAFVLQN